MKPQPLPLAPGDYYFNEQGLMVFTAQYHLRRGYCCGSGCKHCPFKPSQKAPPAPDPGSEKDDQPG